jgi:hypothetical protein
VTFPIGDGVVAFRLYDELDERDDMEEMLRAVPAALRCYQVNFSAVELYAGGHMWLQLWDRLLFASVRERGNMESIQKNHRIRAKRLARLHQRLGDLWQVRTISSDQGDRNLLLINKNRPEEQKLYCVMDGKYEDYFELADPRAAFDAYLSSVLRGNFDRFDFTPFRA